MVAKDSSGCCSAQWRWCKGLSARLLLAIAVRVHLAGAAQTYVVHGNLTIECHINYAAVGPFGQRVRETIEKIADVDTRILSLLGYVYGSLDGIPLQQLIIHYVVLVDTIPAADRVINNIVAARGDASASAPFQQLLAWQVDSHPETASLSVGDWPIALGHPEANYLDLDLSVSPSVLPNPSWFPSSTTLTTSSGDPGGVVTTTTTYASVTATTADVCAQGAVPCLCAVLPVCRWSLARCTPKVSSTADGVSCEDCPIQPHCAYAKCASTADPCSCMQSPWDCRWDDVAGACRLRNGGVTSCSGCARQAHCDPPLVAGYSPSSGSLLGLDANMSIEVSFDRGISVCPAPFGAAAIHCRNPRQSVVLNSSHVSISGRILNVDLPPSTHHATSICDLVLAERAVCDSSGTPFLGLGEGVYTFKLHESVAPSLVGFSPARNEESVAIDTVIALTFSEVVALSSTVEARATLHTDDSGSFVIDLDAHLDENGTVLTVNTRGHLQWDTTYWLTLPSACAVDLSGNNFTGLVSGAYSFKTARMPVQASSDSDSLPLLTIIVILVVIVFVLVCCGLVIWKFELMHSQSKQIRNSAWTNWTRRSGSSMQTRSSVDVGVENSAKVGMSWAMGRVRTSAKGAKPNRVAPVDCEVDSEVSECR